MPASEAASPAPLALADVPSPLLLAVTFPSENELVEAVLPVVSTEPSESESMCPDADAEPSPTDAADRSRLADEDAEAVPSVAVLVAELAASTDAVLVIEPPPIVAASTSPSAVDADVAELPSDVASVEPAAKAWPLAVPSAIDEPVTAADAVEPSSVAAVALAAPEADAPAPTVTRSADASACPSSTPSSTPKEALVSPSAVASSVRSPVASVVPVALAWRATRARRTA